MKIACRFVMVVLSLLAVHSGRAAAYYPFTFNEGYTLFHDNVLAADTSITSVFAASATPVGTQVSLWNSTLNTYDTVSEYLGGGLWTAEIALTPGKGARLYAPETFINYFVGEVVDRDGLLFDDFPFVEPPPFAGPNGLYLLGDKAPVFSSGNSLFMHVVGRLPNPGEQVITLTTTSTFTEFLEWDIEPQLTTGQAAFFNIGPVAVPEPSVMVIGLLAAALGCAFRSRR